MNHGVCIYDISVVFIMVSNYKLHLIAHCLWEIKSRILLANHLYHFTKKSTFGISVKNKNPTPLTISLVQKEMKKSAIY